MSQAAQSTGRLLLHDAEGVNRSSVASGVSISFRELFAGNQGHSCKSRFIKEGYWLTACANLYQTVVGCSNVSVLYKQRRRTCNEQGHQQHTN
jgi:hypothetical protein